MEVMDLKEYFLFLGIVFLLFCILLKAPEDARNIVLFFP